MGGTRTVTAGFIPLLDAAVPIVARELGFAEGEGLELSLVRETSWANIRDRIAIGHFDAAHMLAPMAIAGSLGLPPLPVPLLAPLALGTGRNAITIALDLWDRIQEAGAGGTGTAGPAVTALAQTCAKRADGDPLKFGVVHPYSAHAYLLRYWLAEGGLRPDQDVLIEVIPPPFMADALLSRRIDGCCVGEPWNSVAVMKGAGRVLTTSDEIWPQSPDKVLGFRANWALRNEETLFRLIRAHYRAALWCDDPSNTDALLSLLARPEYLDAPREILRPGLLGELLHQPGGAGRPSFALGDAAFPWRSHAVWFLTQMARWGHAPLTEDTLRRARETYRPEFFRAALPDEVTGIPEGEDYAQGGGRKGLFDGRAFDPRDARAYLESLPGTQNSTINMQK